MPFGKGAQALELGRVSLVAAKGKEIVLVPWREPGETRTLQAPFDVAELAISPSERFLAAAPARKNRRQVAYFDLEEGGMHTVEASGSEVPMTAFTYFKDHFNESFVVARAERGLWVLDRTAQRERGALGSGWCIMDQLTQVSIFHLAVVGHGEGEKTDSLTIFRLETGTDFSRLSDDVARLNVGPAPHNAFVGFRDHEGSERGENPNNALWGFVGLYLRDADTEEVLQRIPWEGPIRRNDRLFATNNWIALAMGPKAALVSRAGDARIEFDGVASAVDVHLNKLALLTADGEAIVLDPY